MLSTTPVLGWCFFCELNAFGVRGGGYDVSVEGEGEREVIRSGL